MADPALSRLRRATLAGDRQAAVRLFYEALRRNDEELLALTAPIALEAKIVSAAVPAARYCGGRLDTILAAFDLAWRRQPDLLPAIVRSFLEFSRAGAVARDTDDAQTSWEAMLRLGYAVARAYRDPELAVQAASLHPTDSAGALRTIAEEWERLSDTFRDTVGAGQPVCGYLLVAVAQERTILMQEIRDRVDALLEMARVPNPGPHTIRYLWAALILRGDIIRDEQDCYRVARRFVPPAMPCPEFRTERRGVGRWLRRRHPQRTWITWWPINRGFGNVVFPLIRRVFGGLMGNDLVSVQPMTAPQGSLFYLDHQYRRAEIEHDPTIAAAMDIYADAHEDLDGRGGLPPELFGLLGRQQRGAYQRHQDRVAAERRRREQEARRAGWAEGVDTFLRTKSEALRDRWGRLCGAMLETGRTDALERMGVEPPPDTEEMARWRPLTQNLSDKQRQIVSTLLQNQADHLAHDEEDRFRRDP